MAASSGSRPFINLLVIAASVGFILQHQPSRPLVPVISHRCQVGVAHDDLSNVVQTMISE